MDRPRRRDLPAEGQVLLLVTLGLTAFGQVMVYSASSPLAMSYRIYGYDSLYFVKHGLPFTILGILLMLIVMRAKPGWLRVGAPAALLRSYVLLVAVLIPGVGATINGARRWIAVGPLTLQPSELAKLALLGTIAALLTAKKRPPQTLGELIKPIGVLTAVACVLILAEPDLGSAIATAMMVFAMLWVAGVPSRLLAVVLFAGMTLASAAIWYEPYRRDRFLAFLHPQAHATDGSYQVLQGMIAAASGGVSGGGLGASQQKNLFLPEAHTDMIFAIIAEELGLIGTVIVVAGFAAFAWAGFTIALRARDRYCQIVAAGATALIAGQACVNVGAVLGILPLTGIPLPLISYGSSSKVVTLVVVGVLLAICREGNAPQPVRADGDRAARTQRAARRAAARAV